MGNDCDNPFLTGEQRKWIRENVRTGEHLEFKKHILGKWKSEEEMSDLRWDPEKGMQEKRQWKAFVEVELEKIGKFRTQYFTNYKELNERIHVLEEKLGQLTTWHEKYLAPSMQKSDLQEKIEAFSLLEDE